MTDYDLVLRRGSVHDGSGAQPWVGDVAIFGDRIAALGPDLRGRGRHEWDVQGCVVAPGFINMMSWAVETLIEDGRSMSDVRQGVTLEVMGEGTSMGPLNESMRQALESGGLDGGDQGFRYPVEWTTLYDYLRWLTRRGVSTNVASFVGAGTLRVHAMGHADRPATSAELESMCALLEDEMRHGALGVASALIYPPETAFSTEELVALGRVAAAYGGTYASHIRSEGAGLVAAVAELIEICRRSGANAEIYHLKATGRANWPLQARAIELVEDARAEGLAVTADVYPYEYAGTSLSACIPPWAHRDGPEALRRRLGVDTERARIRADLERDTWENPFLDATPAGIQVRGPLVDSMTDLVGLSLEAIAARWGTTPQSAVMDLVRDNPGDIFALYHDMDADNVRRVAEQPWVSFCSDAESLSVEAATARGGVHPRAFGAFARVLGGFVRDEGLFTLPDAVRRMTSLPADTLGLVDRGRLRVGCYADVVVFDPDAVIDHATPEQPAQYASGMVHVLVNGVVVLRDGRHNGASPGRFVRGPGHRTGGARGC